MADIKVPDVRDIHFLQITLTPVNGQPHFGGTQGYCPFSYFWVVACTGTQVFSSKQSNMQQYQKRNLGPQTTLVHLSSSDVGPPISLFATQEYGATVNYFKTIEKPKLRQLIQNVPNLYQY